MSKPIKVLESFRNIRLGLARESGHPLGDPGVGYDLFVPLDRDNRLDVAECRRHQAHCQVRRFAPGVSDRIGLLRRAPGGKWFFQYESDDTDDEIGFRLGEERFVVGEYVSLSHGNDTHTYRVEWVEKPRK